MSQLDAVIMGQPYKLACKEGEEEALQQAVAYLDEKMCAIRDAGKIKGNDRIAVTAALSIAAEFLSIRFADGPFASQSIADIKQRISAMNALVDEALTPQENLF